MVIFNGRTSEIVQTVILSLRLTPFPLYSLKKACWLFCMNQQQLAHTPPWVGHLLSEHQIQTGGLPSVITTLNTTTAKWLIGTLGYLAMWRCGPLHTGACLCCRTFHKHIFCLASTHSSPHFLISDFKKSWCNLIAGNNDIRLGNQLAVVPWVLWWMQPWVVAVEGLYSHTKHKEQ